MSGSQVHRFLQLRGKHRLCGEVGRGDCKEEGPTAARVVIVVSTATPPDLTSDERLRKSAPCMEVGVCDELPGFSAVWLFHV